MSARLGWNVSLLSAAFLMAASTFGCSPKQSPQQPLAFWPWPPAPPRIALLRTISGSADFDQQAGFLERLGEIVLGSGEHNILRPQGVAVEHDQRLYVTDLELQGVHVFNFHSSKSSFINRAGKVFFVSPVAVAVCDDSIAIADSVLKKVFLLKPDGKLTGTLERPGGFERPTGLAFDPQAKLIYVVDTLANEVCVFEPSGGLVRRFGSAGEEPGQFNYPTYVFVDKTGRVYVTDSLNFRVQVFDRQGRFLFHIGELGNATGYMAVPKGVGVDSFGHIYVVDSRFSVIQVYDQQGRFLLSFGGPGQKVGAFQVPSGLTVDSSNRIFVCDSYNSRVQIFQYIGKDDEQTSLNP